MVLDLWIKFGCFVQEPFKKALVRKKEKKKVNNSKQGLLEGS